MSIAVILATWTALFVYGDGRVVANEDLKNEQTCKEAMCAVRYGQSCAAKAKADEEAKARQEKAEAERKEKIALYRIDHPCKPQMDDSYEHKNEKVTRYHCPLPDGGEQIYDENGKPVWSTGAMMVMGGSVFVSNSDRELRYSACFQQ